MKKILAIGNSFSQDATSYLHDIAVLDSIDLKVVNLYIGGCSLEMHCENIAHNNKTYLYELNGLTTERYVSIQEALTEDTYDYITIQQVSNDSGILNSFYPFTEELLTFIRSLAPSSKIFLHQTWAYETDSTHSCFINYNSDQEEMFLKLQEVNKTIAEEFSLPVIPCGEVIQELRKYQFFDYQDGGVSLCRDGFHLDLLYGRFAAAATWYESILGMDITKNSFQPVDHVANTALDPYVFDRIRQCVHSICN